MFVIIMSYCKWIGECCLLFTLQRHMKRTNIKRVNIYTENMRDYFEHEDLPLQREAIEKI